MPDLEGDLRCVIRMGRWQEETQSFKQAKTPDEGQDGPGQHLTVASFPEPNDRKASRQHLGFFGERAQQHGQQQ